MERRLSTVHFDWLKVKKAITPVLPKNLRVQEINLQNSVNDLDFSLCNDIFSVKMKKNL